MGNRELAFLTGLAYYSGFRSGKCENVSKIRPSVVEVCKSAELASRQKFVGENREEMERSFVNKVRMAKLQYCKWDW